MGLGKGSQGSCCNYTSQSLWSVARLTSFDYTASAIEAEMAGGRQVVVGEEAFHFTLEKLGIDQDSTF